MENLIEAIISFFVIMGMLSTSLIIIGFLLKAKGIRFVEFFPKKEEALPQQIIYNNVVPQTTNPTYYGIDSKKVAAIMAAIQYHNKIKG